MGPGFGLVKPLGKSFGAVRIDPVGADKDMVSPVCPVLLSSKQPGAAPGGQRSAPLRH